MLNGTINFKRIGENFEIVQTEQKKSFTTLRGFVKDKNFDLN